MMIKELKKNYALKISLKKQLKEVIDTILPKNLTEGKSNAWMNLLKLIKIDRGLLSFSGQYFVLLNSRSEVITKRE